MKKYLVLVPLILLFSCISDKDRFDVMKKEYSHCEILSQGQNYYAVDTTSLHGAIYLVTFFPNNSINRVDRLR
jgi:hypothetical protein